MEKVLKSVVIILFLSFISITSFAIADEVTDVINEALQNYKKGDYASAVNNLDYAAQLIRQKKSESLEVILPKPLSGWQANDSKSQAAGSSMFGGGVSIEKEYTKDSSTINIKIVTDSPMLQGVLMMFSNPFMVSNEGKLERISGQKAIVKYDSSNKEGEINIVVANRYLVTITGNDVTKDDLTNYAKTIDYNKLTSMQ
ncbi:MAG: hypothetical protein HQK76_09485 [Desulfobacterales bacterium]|nr:hypothetical protein [Desulfobacterales bacterium]